MPNIKNRVFGSPIKESIANKLRARQYLAGTGVVTVDDVENLKSEFPSFGQTIEDYEMETEFGTEIDLSSRTPFARMWTGIEWSSVINAESAEEKPTDLKENESWDPYERRILTYGENEAMIYQINNSITNVHTPGHTIEIGGQGARLYPNLMPWDGTDNRYAKPPSGITRISSETDGIIGAIKKTTIDFTVHNFWDFDKIYSRYFLRPGAQIFVDFGWAMVLDELYDPYCIIDTWWCTEEMQSWTPEEALYADYGNKKGYVTKSNGDYETIVGNVVNYDAKIRDDGGVDCTLEIVSKNVLLLENEFSSKIKAKLTYGLDLEIIKFMASAFDGEKAKMLLGADWNISPKNKAAWEEVYQIFARNVSIEGSLYKNTPSPKSMSLGIFYNGLEYNSKKLYITFGLFEDLILNSQFGFGKTLNDILNKNNTGGNFESKFDSSNSWASYNHNLLYRQQSAGDKENLQFILPPSWDNGTTYSTGTNKVPYRVENEALTDEEIEQGYSLGNTGTDIRLNRIPLREIFISVDTIKNAIEISSSTGEMLKSILDTLNSNSLDFFDFQLENNKMDNQLSIIDRNYIHINFSLNKEETIKDMFMFNVMTDDTLVNQYDLSFSTPQGNLQNMIAIQAMGDGNSMYPFDDTIDTSLSLRTLDSEKEMAFKYLPEIGQYQYKNLDNVETFSQTLSNYYQDLKADTSVDDNYKSFLDSKAFEQVIVSDDLISKAKSSEKIEEEDHKKSNKGKTPEFDDDNDARQEEREANVKSISTLSEYFLHKAKNDFSIENNSPVLPVTLSLQIYGISGITPGDLFKVSYLPSRYKKNIYFQVTKVTQDVGESWVTNIETVMRIHKKDLSKHRKYDNMVLNKSVLTSGSPLSLSSYGSKYNIKSLMKHLTVEIPSSVYDNIDYIFTFEARTGRTIDDFFEYDNRTQNARPFNQMPLSVAKVLTPADGSSVGNFTVGSMSANFNLKSSPFVDTLKEINSKYNDFQIMVWPNTMTMGSRAGLGAGDPNKATHMILSYIVNLKKFEKYKLIVKGKFWIIVPHKFEEIEVINAFYGWMAGTIKGRVLKDDPKCQQCTECVSDSIFGGPCSVEECEAIGPCMHEYAPGAMWQYQTCRPHPDLCYEEVD